jgi:outer membrane protein
VQQQRLAVEIASREVERQRAGHYPTLDLVASTGHNSTLSSGDRELTDANRIGLQLNVPIFQGGEVSSKTAEADANRRAALSAQETARRGAVLQARQSYLGVVNGLAQVKTLQAANAAAQKAMTSNKDAFDVGVRLGIDVLNAQNQVYSTRRDLTRTAVETLIAQLRLKAAVGTLGEEDVQAVNGLLEK